MKTLNEQNGLSRRTLVAGAGTVGFVAASASLLPNPADQAMVALLPPATRTVPKGYHLSEHVKRYYRTTLV